MRIVINDRIYSKRRIVDVVVKLIEDESWTKIRMLESTLKEYEKYCEEIRKKIQELAKA